MKSPSRRSLRRLLAPVAFVVAMSSVLPAVAVTPGVKIALEPKITLGPVLSTSGDYATDNFGDPWDFSNNEDFDVRNGVGTSNVDAASIGGGVLNVTTRNAAEIRMVMNWPEIGGAVLPWGRDGWKYPIDADSYTKLSVRMRADSPLYMALRWWNADDQQGQIACAPGTYCAAWTVDSEWRTYTFDLTDRGSYIFPAAAAVWNRSVTRFEFFRSAPVGGGNAPVNLQVDWVRLHRADAPVNPPSGVPTPQVLTPDEQGGEDYATAVRGNPWDFAGMDDVGETHDVDRLSVAGGDLTGRTIANDGFIGLALGPAINTDKYHRLTVDVCYDGQMSLTDLPGGGMMSRVAWRPKDNRVGAAALPWTETQDIMIFPGCNSITVDLATNPAAALHDQHTGLVTGWRGVNLEALRFDLNEDRGIRGFSLQNIKLADDAAFSTTYPITFRDQAATAGTTAEIYVTTDKHSFNGTKVASVPVQGGVNTFTWNGTSATGAPMPNGTYWVYIVMRNTAGVGTAYSTGPVRLEKPVSSAPSYYVPLMPSRLLDTRTGVGGNLSAINERWQTELPVTGVGGVPAGNVTAVVMNVTVTEPTGYGFVTAWPSGEIRPTVSSLNFQPGQTVPNLVTVKVGANGRVNLFNSGGNSHLVADVVGYYTTSPPAEGGRFTALTPTRLLDTRDGVGTGTPGPINQGQAINLTVVDRGGVPAQGVQAVALNVTVDQPTNHGFLTVWPAGQGMPTASTHNFVPGQTVANLVIAKVGANGQISIFNSGGQSHVVADVVGYFSGQGGLFVPVSPTRQLDTRESAPVLGGETRTYQATTSPIPATATAVVANVTAVDTWIQSFVTVWPSGSSQPVASTLNPRPGLPIPNQAYLRLGSGGSLNLYNSSGATNLIVDVFGYFTN